MRSSIVCWTRKCCQRPNEPPSASSAAVHLFPRITSRALPQFIRVAAGAQQPADPTVDSAAGVPAGSPAAGSRELGAKLAHRQVSGRFRKVVRRFDQNDSDSLIVKSAFGSIDIALVVGCPM